MLTVYGFGAKTSSGFGAAENDITEALIKNSKKPLDPMPNKISELASRINELFEEAFNG